MAGTLALVLAPTSDTGLPLDGLTRRNGVDVGIVGLNLLGGPITIFDDRDNSGTPGTGEILATVPAGLLGTSLSSVRLNLSEGTHNLRATQSATLLGITTTTTSLALPVRVDTTGPTIVSVNQLDTLDPLGLLDLVGVLRYEVTFSEPVLGLTANLFQATGTLPGIHLVTLLPTLSPNTYIVSVGLGLDGVSLDRRAGTLGLALNPSNLSGVTDLAGNGLRGADFALLAPVNIGPARETATADFNGDGLGDAAFLVNNTVVVTRGTGTGSLGATQTVTIAAGQNTIATGDITGDGLADIVTAGNGTVQILKQGTDGTFTVTSRATANADGALIADVNGDGYADLVVKGLAGGTATVLTNNGTGTFSAGTAQSFGVRPDAFVAADFNGDGRIDLAALADNGTQIAVLTQAANGTFARSTLTVGASAGGLAAGDLNGDGRAEIVSSGTGGTLEIRGSSAAGTIQTTLQAGAAATDIRIGDTNGDGRQDILYAGADGNVRVVYGDGAGNFSAPVILETQAGLGALALLDINGDGRQDLALASGTTGTLQVGTGIPVAGVLGSVYNLVAPGPVQTVTAVRVAGDNVVNIAEAAAGTVPVTGTLAGPLGAGETLAVRLGGTVTPLTGATVVTANGVTTFSGIIPVLQASGDVSVLVQRTDGATSAALSQAVTVDLVRPTLLSVTSPDAALTKDTVIDFTLTFSEAVTGLTAANLGLTGTAVTTTPGGLVPTVVTADGGRTYTVTVPAATAEGTLGLTFNPAGIVDAAGNALPGVSAPVGPILTLDRTAPVLSVQPIAGNGVLSQAELAAGVVLEGTAAGLAAGATVTVTITNGAGTAVLTTTAAVIDGAFALPLAAGAGTALTDGSYAVSVSATDAAGNVAIPALANLTIDLTADAGTPFTLGVNGGLPVGAGVIAAVPVAVSGLDAGAIAAVTFTDVNANTVTATLGSNGSALVNLSGLLGPVTSSIVLTDPVGNTAPLTGPALTIDLIAPVGTAVLGARAAATVSFDVTFPETVTGLDTTDFQVVGTGSIVGTVTQATANGAGGYTVVVGNLSGAGTLGLALSANANIVDTAGNLATLFPVVPVSLDLVPPPRPVITGLVSDGGGVPNGFLTVDTTPTLSGTTEAGSTVTVTYKGPGGATGILAATVDGAGNWTATVPTALANGGYAFTATAQDLAGNVSLPTAPKVVTIDTPTALPFTLAIDFDGNIINRADAAGLSYTLGGLPPGAVLSVTFTDADGTQAVVPLVNGGGTLDLSALDGLVTSSLTYTVQNGIPAILVGPGAIFDTVLPTVPTIQGFASAGPVAVTATNDQTPILVGTGEAGSIVTVVVGGQTLTAEVDTSGNWRIPVTTALGAGTVSLTATAQDAAGNVSAPSVGLPVTIDLLADGDATPLSVTLNLPADRLLNASEAAALVGTVSGIDSDATATLTFTGQGGTVSVVLTNGPLPPVDLSGLGGTVTASVSVVDLVGNRATLPLDPITIDAVAPAAIIVADPAAPAGATSLTYTVTFPEAVANLDRTDFVLTGSGTAAGTIVSATEINGTYVVTVGNVTGTGSLALGLAGSSNIADLAGNAAIVAQAGLHLVNVPVVVQPGDLPVIAAITADSGAPGDFITNDADPVVSGTALANGTITLTYTDQAGVPASVTVRANGSGEWSVPLPSLGDGTYALTATLTDAFGNVLGTSASRPLVIDTVADAGLPVSLAVSATADGVIDATEATMVSYTVAGLDVGSTAIVRFALGALVKDVPISADGTFMVDLSGFDGTVATSLIVTDPAANTATVAGNAIRVETTPTAPPIITAVVTDTGTPGDGITYDNTPVLTGTAEANAAVLVTVSGPGGVQTIPTIATGGVWSVTVPTLVDGAYTVTASATGPSGLPSASTAPFALTIDTNADVVPLVAVQFASGDTRLGANEAGAVTFELTGLDTGSSGSILFTDGRTTVTVPIAANGTYTANLSTLSGSITAEVVLADVADNSTRANLALPAGLTVDVVAPQGTAVGDPSGGVTVASFTYAVTFSEAVANVTAGDFALSGPPGLTGEITSVTGSGASYVVTVAGIQGTGLLTLGLASDSDIADLAGNLATLVPATRLVTGVAPVQPVITGYTVDTGVQGDGVTSDQAPTLSGIGLANGTVTITDTASPGSPSVQATVAANGTWSVTLPTQSDGAHAFVASLADANGAPIGTSAPLPLTIDTTADGGAVATLSVDPGGDQRIDAAEAGTVAFTVAGLDPDAMGTVTFRDVTHGLTVMDVRNGTYTVDLSSFAGPVSSVLAIQDAAGNSITRDGTAVVVDAVAPIGTAIPSTPTDTGATGFTYTVTFPETVLDVTLDDFVLASTGTAAGRIVSVSGTGGTYVVSVLDVTGTGTLSLGLAGTSDIADGFGNGATLSATSRSVAIGATPPPAPTFITGYDVDSGIPGDGITRDTTPILSGTAAPGGTVTVVYVEAGVPKSVTGPVDGTGQWTLAIPTLTDGSYSFTASAVTAANVPSGTSVPLALTIDTIADAVPAVSLSVNGPAGGSLTPAQAAAVGFTVAGLDAGSSALVTFTDGSNTVRVNAGADGTYQADLSGLTGTVTSTFAVSDTAGNTASGSGNSLVIGQTGTNPQNPNPQNPNPQNPNPQDPNPQDPTTPPIVPPGTGTEPGQNAPPSVVAPVVVGLQPDTGVPGDGITSDPTPTVTGTGTPGALVTVTYTDGTGPRTVTVPVGADGSFTAPLPNLADGNYSVVAAGRDAAGNVLQAGQPFTVVVDTVADTGPAVALSIEPTADGVINAREAIDTAYTVSGLDAAAVALVTFTDGTHALTTRVTADGRYAVDLTGLNGPVTSAVLATDAAGNEARATGNAVTLDTVGPAAPVVTGFTEDTGLVGNGVTADTTPTLLGAAEPGSTVFIAYETQGGPRTATVVAGTDGLWSVELPPLPEGSYAFTASATDAAGNRGPASIPYGLTIDPRDAGPVGSGGGNATDGGNLAPTPVSDGIATATHAAAVIGNVLANDTDPNAGDSLHVTAVRFASGITVAVPADGTTTILGEHGTLHMAADGSYSYQAIGSSNLGAGGQYTEVFTYTVSDAKGLSTSAGLSVSLGSAVPPQNLAFGFAFSEARVDLKGETLVLTAPDGTQHDLNGIGTLTFTDGSIRQNDGHGVVDDVWYLSHNLDVWAAKMDADTHYATYGWQEGRDPNAYFSTLEYLGTNTDVAAAGLNPLEHYVTYGEREGRSPSAHFSADAYLSLNPDVAAHGDNALEHYFQYGRGEGRNVQEGENDRGHTGAFDPGFYLTQNPDVAAAAAAAAPLTVTPSDYAFRHYLNYGADEGRAPNALFDPGAYLTAYTDVAEAGLNPLLHYEEFGWREGRNPGPAFDTNAYLENNPDVVAANIDPLQHFLDYGMKEGRLPG
ncbi:beta strand repeat-containing protein [Methylobacterium sp. Leaf112]|uniref:beta strand repeat-containing protein n=1 Tax=Methylobacterium sp. Leaf112 TaxID=1736258 RepID=UPI000A75FCFD|nr:Ig-like domain-containing protein [Methylobacterium sp. Leaf112]